MSILRASVLAAPFAFLPLVPAMAQSSEAQVIIPDSALAVEAPEVHALLQGIGMYEVLQIMSVEGIEAAGEMESNMFPGQGGAAWSAVVAGIYSADRLTGQFEAALPVDRFTDEVIADLEAFVFSDIGQRVAAGEIAARRAFLDPGVEAGAEEVAEAMRQDGDARIDQLTEFITLNDLVERNVSGALNANFAFFQGLSDGEAFEASMPDELMLAEVWGQEPEIRADATTWLYAYQVLAYAELTDEELQAYIDLSKTEAGAALNAALFAAFDVMFEQLNYDLGLAAAVFIAGEET